MVGTPIADSTACQYDNLDVFHGWYEEVSQKYDCEFYDFNLLKNKSELFPLDIAFYDWLHLSESGAVTFSKEFTRLIKKVDSGEDVSSLFFDSYVEADANSIYAK